MIIWCVNMHVDVLVDVLVAGDLLVGWPVKGLVHWLIKQLVGDLLVH